MVRPKRAFNIARILLQIYDVLRVLLPRAMRHRLVLLVFRYYRRVRRAFKILRSTVRKALPQLPS